MHPCCCDIFYFLGDTGFIRKVYGILSVQLLLTSAVAAVCVLNDSVRTGILANLWTTWVGFFFSISLLLCLLW